MNTSNAFLSALCAAVLSLCSPAANAGTISYTYDPAGRLVAVDYGADRSTSYVYDNAGNLIQSSQPTPGLAVNPAGNNQLMLSWPAAPGSYSLESSPALGAGAVWTGVGAARTLNGDRFTATVSAGPAAQFYRLRKLF